MPNPIVWLLSSIISLYSMVLFVWIIVSLLISFGMLNRYHPIVNRVYVVLEGLMEPALRPIRRYVPTLGGIDLSPIILILALNFAQYSLAYYF